MRCEAGLLPQALLTLLLGESGGPCGRVEVPALWLCSQHVLVSWQVDNTKFTMDCVVPTIHVYEHHENKWRCRDPH